MAGNIGTQSLAVTILGLHLKDFDSDSIPKKHVKKAHHLILLHGRNVCKSRKPLCEKCIINKICLYKGKNE
jgi:endonuclease III